VNVLSLIYQNGITMTTSEMQQKIEAKIQKLVSIGKTKAEATKMIEKALILVTEGKKKLSDVIDL
jgi:uncharacterized protein YoaH (UPF0181 family)